MNTGVLVMLCVAVVMSIAVAIGAISGWLSWLDDHRVSRALLIGGKASGATLVLAVAVAALLL